MACLASAALQQLEYWLRQRLESGKLDEDQRADAANDIAFIHSIDSDLRREMARATVIA